MKIHTVEDKVTVTDTATRSVAEVGTGCARCCQDICGRQDVTSLLSRGGAIKVLKDGRVRKGEGHLERGIGEFQMFSCHCKPTCGWQAACQKNKMITSCNGPEDNSLEEMRPTSFHFAFGKMSGGLTEMGRFRKKNGDGCRNSYCCARPNLPSTLLWLWFRLAWSRCCSWLYQHLLSDFKHLFTGPTAKITVTLINPLCLFLEVSTWCKCTWLFCICATPGTIKPSLKSESGRFFHYWNIDIYKKRWIFMQARDYEHINIYRNVRKSLPHGLQQVSFGRSALQHMGYYFTVLKPALARLSQIWLFLLSFGLISWNPLLCYCRTVFIYI